jgi:hypothetical protein
MKTSTATQITIISGAITLLLGLFGFNKAIAAAKEAAAQAKAKQDEAFAALTAQAKKDALSKDTPEMTAEELAQAKIAALEKKAAVSK